MKRNVVCIDYSDYLEETLKISETLNKLGDFKLISNYKVEDIKRKQGFLLILFLDDIYNYYKLGEIWNLDNDDNYFVDIYEFDKLYRKKLGKFRYTIVLDCTMYKDKKVPLTNIYTIIYDDDSPLKLERLIKKMLEEDSNKKEIKFTKKRLENIKKLKTCINKMSKDYFNMSDLQKKLKVNKKWLQRYLKDMNYIYNNVGYDKRKKAWYVIKNN